MKRYKCAICILSVMLGTAVIILVSVILHGSDKTRYVYGDFKAPEFEANAVTGSPDITDVHGYSRFTEGGMEYSVCLMRQLNMADANSARILFTNEQSNAVWLKLRVISDRGKIIAETGLIKPGQYIDTIFFDETPKKGSIVTLKVMGYEPRTYHSAGSISIEAKIGG